MQRNTVFCVNVYNNHNSQHDSSFHRKSLTRTSTAIRTDTDKHTHDNKTTI